MKTITFNGSNISTYIFADDDTITATETNTVIPDTTEFSDPFIICDLNTSNSTIHTGVTIPEDWKGGKYLFSLEGNQDQQGDLFEKNNAD